MPEQCLGKQPEYSVWAGQGLLQTTRGDFCDYDSIRDEVDRLRRRYRFTRLLMDRYQANQLAGQLQQILGEDKVQFIGQGFQSMTGPTREIETLVAANRLAGLQHPILRWMAGNAEAQHGENGAVKLRKPRDGGRKIDALMALVMAAAALPDLKDTPSFAKTKGVRFL